MENKRGGHALAMDKREKMRALVDNNANGGGIGVTMYHGAHVLDRVALPGRVALVDDHGSQPSRDLEVAPCAAAARCGEARREMRRGMVRKHGDTWARAGEGVSEVAEHIHTRARTHTNTHEQTRTHTHTTTHTHTHTRTHLSKGWYMNRNSAVHANPKRVN